MKTLVLGGTGFLGRWVVESALAHGHDVTVFARGPSEPFHHVEHLHGDRDGSLDELRERRWEAVIDCSGFHAKAVAASARAIGRSSGIYAFVSSVSAYADLSRPGLDEAAPLTVARDGDYGARKAACERVLRELLPGRLLTVRPGLLAGPGESSGRFLSWPLRVARGGEVLVPGPPQRTIQFLDARDLAEWLVRLVGARTVGVFNAVGPRGPLPAAGFLAACVRVTASEARPIWVDEGFLLAHGVVPWADVPLWSTGKWAGFQRVDGTKAVAAGLTHRPVAETIGDALGWAAEQPQAMEQRGLDAEREASLLAAWRRVRG